MQNLNITKTGITFGVALASMHFLWGLLVLSGLERKKVFITNIVHHRPPENRDPLPNEIEAYGKYLDQIINIVKPKIIITLGRFSMAKFLPNVFISQVHGKSFKLKNFTVIPMYHPAASLRNGKILEAEKNKMIEEAKGEIVSLVVKATEKLLESHNDESFDKKALEQIKKI
jgi:DNA polymerase